MKSESDRQECNISNMIKFMLTIQNPVHVSLDTEHHLHYILAQENLPIDISMDLINIFEIGESLYTDFCKKRFIQKSEKLSETIHRKKVNHKISSKTSKKNDLGCVRQYNVKELFKYNLVSNIQHFLSCVRPF